MAENKPQDNSNFREEGVIEKLETLAFHFTQVCKRLSQDREHWAESGKELTKAVENLSSTLQQFTELEKKTREQVVNVISSGSKEAARTIAGTLSQKTEEVFTKQTTEAANYLSRVIGKAKDTLEDYQWQVGKLRRWFLIGIVFSSLIGNILAGLGVYYFLSNKEDNNALAIIREIKAIEKREKTHTPMLQRSRTQTKLLK